MAGQQRVNDEPHASDHRVSVHSPGCLASARRAFAAVCHALENPRHPSIPQAVLPVHFAHRSVAVAEARNRRSFAAARSNPGPDVDEELRGDVEDDLHMQAPVQLAAHLNTSLESGLSSAEAEKRLSTFGPNKLVVKQPSLTWQILGYLFSGFGIILWPAVLLCFLAYQPLGSPPEIINLGLGVLLLLVIFMQAGFNAYQEHESSKVMASIRNLLPTSVGVLRDGQLKDVLAENIVPGDLVVLTLGEKIPADMQLVEVQELKIDQSSLTGESVPVTRTTVSTDDNPFESRNVIHMGTAVVEGSGKAIATRTGSRTTMGKIASLAASTKNVSSRLTREINCFVIVSSMVAVSLASFVMILWAAWLRSAKPTFLSASGAVDNAISTAVAFVPVGLPVAFTTALTIIARRMARNSVLVKRLDTVETLGSIDMIASDKTGTLTQNIMTVVSAYFPGASVSYSADQTLPLFGAHHSPAVENFVTALTHCSDAQYGEATEPGNNATRKVIGDATDVAIMRYIDRLWDVTEQRSAVGVLARLPFNSRNKYMITVHRFPDGAVVVLLKGAAERVLDHCLFALALDDVGAVVPLTKQIRCDIAHNQEALCSEGQRVLGVSQLRLVDARFKDPEFRFCMDPLNFPLEGMCFLGLVGIMDPPRPQVAGAIAKCQQAGIRVTMVTGDHPATAVAIARSIGIVTLPTRSSSDYVPPAHPIEKDLEEKERSCNKCCCFYCTFTVSGETQAITETTHAIVVTGSDIPGFTEGTWDWIFSHKELVFARTSPKQKLSIVMAAQKRKHAVAVTGDGINDAAALKQADVGVAMGGGSDVAREAAKLVLLTDNFAGIVYGVENGRIFYDNLKKVLLFFLPAGSFCELLPVLANVVLGLPLALNAFEMIFICIVTDLFPSLALMYEKGETDLMSRPPRANSSRLVDWRLILHAYLFYGIIEAVWAFFAFFLYMGLWGGFSLGTLFLAYDKYPTTGNGFYTLLQNGSFVFTGKLTSPGGFFLVGSQYLTSERLANFLYTGQTVFFVCLVITQIGCVFAIRTRRLSIFQQNPFWGPTRNLFLPIAVLISLCSVVIAVYVPFIHSIFLTRQIPWPFWLLPIGGALSIFGLDELRKLGVRLWPGRLFDWLAW